MTLWIKPSAVNRTSIIHASSGSNGGGYWCVGMLGLSHSGQVIAYSYRNGSLSLAGPSLIPNMWTYLAMTYSASNGLRLYVNGTLRNSTALFSYFASGLRNYLFLGNSLNGTTCGGNHGQFSGTLDEFRLYSRELTTADVWTLFSS